MVTHIRPRLPVQAICQGSVRSTAPHPCISPIGPSRTQEPSPRAAHSLSRTFTAAFHDSPDRPLSSSRPLPLRLPRAAHSLSRLPLSLPLPLPLPLTQDSLSSHSSSALPTESLPRCCLPLQPRQVRSAHRRGRHLNGHPQPPSGPLELVIHHWMLSGTRLFLVRVILGPYLHLACPNSPSATPPQLPLASHSAAPGQQRTGVATSSWQPHLTRT